VLRTWGEHLLPTRNPQSENIDSNIVDNSAAMKRYYHPSSFHDNDTDMDKMSLSVSVNLDDDPTLSFGNIDTIHNTQLNSTYPSHPNPNDSLAILDVKYLNTNLPNDDNIMMSTVLGQSYPNPIPQLKQTPRQGKRMITSEILNSSAVNTSKCFII
jgi:hypothetical protein